MDDATRRLLNHFQKVHYDFTHPTWRRAPTRIARRYLKYGESIYEQLFELETARTLPTKLSDTEVAENAFFSSLQELQNKLSTKDFYVANAYLFRRYARVLSEKSREASPDKDIEQPISRLMRDAIYLLQTHNLRFGSQEGYGYYQSSFEPFYLLYSRSHSSIFLGSVIDPGVGSLTIRAALESRLKSALGTFAIYDKSRTRYETVKMSSILDALEMKEHEIRIGVPLKMIRMVYNWTNEYIHAGFISFSWLSYFAYDLLSPLFTPAYFDEGKEFDFGIVMSRSILEELREIIRCDGRRNVTDRIIDGPSIDNCALGLID